MPLITTTTTTRNTNLAVHTISFRGLAGAMFVLLGLGTMLFLVGFFTVGWSHYGRSYYGLWQHCTCSSISNSGSAHTTVKVMMIIGLIGMFVALLLAFLYLSVLSLSKNTIILALVITCFLSCIFTLVGFIIYSTENDRYGDLSYSFAASALGSILCLVVGILAIIQMRSSGVRL